MGAIYDINGNSLLTVESPNLTDIPIIAFVTESGMPRSKSDGEVAVKISFKSALQDFFCFATVKIQGSSSQYYPKKNYTVKLFSDSAHTKKNKIQFKDWRSSNKYVLKANWIDHSHARNIVNARLWAKVVQSRSDFNSLPDQFRAYPVAVDGFPVKVYYDGIYQGLHTWNIPKDALYGFDDDLAENALMESDPETAGTYDCARFRTNTNDGAWGDETHSEMPQVISTAWDSVLTFVNSSSDSDFRSQFNNYIDKQSVIDQYILLYLALILDNVAKNQFFYTYDAVKWYGGMYDMDGTWGCPPFPPNHPDWYDYNVPFPSGYTTSGTTNKLYDRVGSLFASDIKTRYSELRGNILSNANILAAFDEFMHVIPPYLYEEDYAETTAGGAYVNIPLKDSNNILQIRNFVNARCAYVDSMVLT